MTSRWVRARGFNFRTALLVGTGPKAAQLGGVPRGAPALGLPRRRLPRRRQRRRDPPARSLAVPGPDHRHGGRPDRGEVVDEVIFVIEKGKLAEYEEALLVAERHGVRAHVSLDIFPHVLARPVLEELDGIPLLSFTTTPSNPGQLVAKRAHRPRALARALPGDAADPGPRGARDPADLGIPDPLPSGALRPERPPLHAAQVPHDGAGVRGAAVRGLAPERDDRAGLQGPAGPAD